MVTTIHGKVHGKIIELDQDIGLGEGQEVEIQVKIIPPLKSGLVKNGAGQVEYQYLKPKQGSNYRQLFVNSRIRAEILYRETIGLEPLTPEKVAKEYELPIEAVVEAIDYCICNRDLLDAERNREATRIKAAHRDKWPYAPRTSGTKE